MYWTVSRFVLPPRSSDSLALVVQGVRRCGKSTLLAQMMERYRLNPRHCAYLNFEDPRLGQQFDYSLLDTWVTTFRKAHPRLKKAYFFLDEVQGVTGWEQWLRTQLERPMDNYFVVDRSSGIRSRGSGRSAAGAVARTRIRRRQGRTGTVQALGIKRGKSSKVSARSLSWGSGTHSTTPLGNAALIARRMSSRTDRAA